MNYLSQIAQNLGIVGVTGIALWLFVIVIFWELVWKLIAMWKSARKKHVAWFIVLALFNTIGILPILYIFVFSKMKCGKPVKKRKVKGKVKRKRKRR